MKTRVVVNLLICLLLTMATTAAVFAITIADQLQQGRQAIVAQDQRTRDAGIAALEGVVQRAPMSPEAGEASYRLGVFHKADRAKSLTYFSKAYSIPGPMAPHAGLSLANTYYALKQRGKAAEVFADVAAKYPQQAPLANYHAAMIYLGDSRTDLSNRTALRSKASSLFAKSGTPEAQIQILGMRFENATDGKERWAQLEKDLLQMAGNPSLPTGSPIRATAWLMLAERCLDSDRADEAVSYADEVVSHYSECRTESARAHLIRGGALQELRRLDEAIAEFDFIWSNYTDTDNFGGRDVRALAMVTKAEILSSIGNRADAARVRDDLRNAKPDCKYLQEN